MVYKNVSCPEQSWNTDSKYKAHWKLNIFKNVTARNWKPFIKIKWHLNQNLTFWVPAPWILMMEIDSLTQAPLVCKDTITQPFPF